MATQNAIRSPRMILFLVIFLWASCKFITSSFAEIAFRSFVCGSAIFSPSRVCTGVSSASDMEINIAESGTDNPCSHLETVCRTTFSLTASSCCESPLDFLIALIFSLRMGNRLLSPGCYHYCRRNCPLPQATHLNIIRKRRFYSIILPISAEGERRDGRRPGEPGGLG